MEKIATNVDERRREYFEHSKKTNGYDFIKYRNEIMTEEERKLGEKIMEHFKESKDAKDRAGVYRDMEIAEAYWSGEFVNKTADTMANTNIINTNIETQVADLMDQNIDVEPKPYDPSDAPYVARVRTIAQRILDENQMPMLMQRTVRRFKKFGSAWIRVLFNPEMLEGLGCPEITSISPANIYPDASVTKIEDIHKGRYFIEAYPASTYWAEQEFGMKKASAIYAGYKPYSQDLGILERESIDTTGENYMHILYWCKHIDEKTGKAKLRLIQCSGCGVILRDSLDFESKKNVDVFPKREIFRYPYWPTNDMERENSVWGKTNASLLYPVQDVIDEIDNAILSNARLVGNPNKLVLTGSGIEPDSIDNTEGQVIPTNVANGMTYMAPPQMPNFVSDRRREAIDSERVVVSRVSDQSAGIKQHGVDTATESLALQQNSMKSVDATKTILQMVLADVMTYCIELAIEFWDKNMFFDIGENKFDYFKPSDLKRVPVLVPADDKFKKAFQKANPNKELPEYMQLKNKFRKLKVIMNINIGAGLPKNKSLMYNIIKETYANGAMSTEEYRKRLEEYVGLPYDETMMMQGGGMSTGQDQLANQVPIQFNQSRDVFGTGGVNKKALDRIEQQRTGGNFNASK